jgi:hypothetical protein
MAIGKLAYPVVLFVSGLGVGLLWNHLERPHTGDGPNVADIKSANEKFVRQMRKMYGEETAEFVKQFEDMTIRTNTHPIKAFAAPDGRFVIRLSRSDETIASDLRYPEKGGIAKELVRHYGFSCNGSTYSCDFGRRIEDSKMTNVLFSVLDAEGNSTFSYVDSDADGRWDWFCDYTQEPPKSYDRDGLCWKEREKVTPKEHNSVP